MIEFETYDLLDMPLVRRAFDMLVQHVIEESREEALDEIRFQLFDHMEEIKNSQMPEADKKLHLQHIEAQFESYTAPDSEMMWDVVDDKVKTVLPEYLRLAQVCSFLKGAETEKIVTAALLAPSIVTPRDYLSARRALGRDVVDVTTHYIHLQENVSERHYRMGRAPKPARVLALVCDAMHYREKAANPKKPLMDCIGKDYREDMRMRYVQNRAALGIDPMADHFFAQCFNDASEKRQAGWLVAEKGDGFGLIDAFSGKAPDEIPGTAKYARKYYKSPPRRKKPPRYKPGKQHRFC